MEGHRKTQDERHTSVLLGVEDRRCVGSCVAAQWEGCSFREAISAAPLPPAETQGRAAREARERYQLPSTSLDKPLLSWAPPVASLPCSLLQPFGHLYQQLPALHFSLLRRHGVVPSSLRMLLITIGKLLNISKLFFSAFCSLPLRKTRKTKVIYKKKYTFISF